MSQDNGIASETEADIGAMARELAKGPTPPRHEMIEFFKELVGESDRAAVIVGAARLDTALEHLLRSSLVPSPTSKDELFEAEGALGTFSARIDLAYRLGLVDPAFCRALHLVRRMRNTFAHAAVGVSLTTEANRLREFLAPLRKQSKFLEEASSFTDMKQGPGAEFRWAITLMVIALDARADFAVPPSWRTAPVGIIPDWWTLPTPVEGREPAASRGLLSQGRPGKV